MQGGAEQGRKIESMIDRHGVCRGGGRGSGSTPLVLNVDFRAEFRFERGTRVEMKL